MTTEEGPADGFAARMAFALEKDPDEPARRTHFRLKMVAVVLAWLVTVPILLVYGFTSAPRAERVFDLAAFVTMLGPFAAAVIATKNHRFGWGGAFIVLTLLMALPAAAIFRF